MNCAYRVPHGPETKVKRRERSVVGCPVCDLESDNTAPHVVKGRAALQGISREGILLCHNNPAEVSRRRPAIISGRICFRRLGARAKAKLNLYFNNNYNYDNNIKNNYCFYFVMTTTATLTISGYHSATHSLLWIPPPISLLCQAHPSLASRPPKVISYCWKALEGSRDRGQLTVGPITR